MKKAKRYPKPDYCKCNKGHELVEVYNEKKHSYDWDCPICIKAQKQAEKYPEMTKRGWI